ncbi:MAG TPA: GNAT family N-acetyltransferase, partial [Gemmatimonadaceae bacterium]|nr:GNAT family N-acetyltransferase [Gemmatimonadaceae bacterium]
EVKRVMEVTREGSLITLTERETDRPTKDYDVFPGEGPASWPKRFKMSGWRFFAARIDGERVGGAAIVARSDAVELLEGRSDLALLWDIRVAPAARRTGVGSALLQGVESWARDQRITTIKVETQDINVPACRFYLRHGYVLRSAIPNAYRDFPDETQLLWYKEIGAATRDDPATSGSLPRPSTR